LANISPIFIDTIKCRPGVMVPPVLLSGRDCACWKQHDLKLRALQEALIAGEESGESYHFDSEAFLAWMRAKNSGFPLSRE
jgi:hypothetical protein